MKEFQEELNARDKAGFGNAISGASKPGDEDYPYPVVELLDGLDLHVVPGTDDQLLWVVDRGTGDLVASTRVESCSWFNPSARNEVLQRLQRSIPGRRQPTGFTNELRRAFKTELNREFDQEFRRKLRPPALRSLISHSKQPVIRRNKYENQNGLVQRTIWNIRVTAENDSSFNESYTTDQIASRSPNRFVLDYNGYGRRIRLSNDSWFELTTHWISTAKIEGYADTEVLQDTPEDHLFRRSNRGFLHFVHRETGESACHHAPSFSERAPFKIDQLPIPQQLCNLCTPDIKRLQLSERIRSEYEL